MAWPFTRLVDFFANTVPTIKATFLNTIQDYFIALFSGTKTVVSLHADGVGDLASTAAAGDVKASGSVRPQKNPFGTTMPTPAVAIDEHTWGRERCCMFTVATPGDPPVFTGGDMVYSMARVGTGLYEIVWNFVPTVTANNIVCHANYHGSGYNAQVITTDTAGPGGRFRSEVGILNSAHNLADAVARIGVVCNPR